MTGRRSRAGALRLVEKEEREILYQLRCTGWKTVGPKEEALERIATTLLPGSGVTALSSEIVAAADAEDASISATEELVRATQAPGCTLIGGIRKWKMNRN